MAADGSIIIDTKIDESQLDDTVNQVSQKLRQIEKNTGNSFAKLRDFMQGPIAALQQLKSALSTVYNAFIVPASAAEELQSKFETVFDGITAETEEWIVKYSKATARGVQDTKEFISTLQDIRTGFGDNAASAAKYSQAVVGVTNDLSSFSNVPFAEASAAIQSGLSGQFEALRRLGVGLNVAIIDQGNYAASIGKTWQTMSNLEKQEAVLSGIMEQSKNAIHQNVSVWTDYNYTLGDAAKTSGSFTNQSQLLNGQLKDAAAIIGSQILPAASQLITTINQVLSAFIDWAKAGDNLKNTFTALKASMTAAAYVLTAGMLPAIIEVAKGWKSNSIVIETTVAVLIQKFKLLALTIETAFVVGFNAAKVAALQFASTMVDKVFGTIEKMLGILGKLPGVGKEFQGLTSDVTSFKNSIKGATDQAIADSQRQIASTNARKAAIAAEGNAEIAMIKLVGNTRYGTTQDKIANDQKETQSKQQAMAAQDIAEQKVADKSTKRTEKKKKEQKEELVGIEKISKAYEDMVAKMDSSNASFLDGLKSMNDMLSTSIGGMSETLDLLSFAGPIGQASQFYDKIIELGGAIESIITDGPAKAAEMMDTLVNSVVGIIDHLPELGMAVVKIIQTVFIKLVEALPDILTGLMESSMTMGPAMSIAIIKAIPDMVKAMALFPIELAKSVPDMITNLGSAFWQMGKEIVHMIGQGIIAVGNLIQWLGEILPNPADIEPFNIGDIGRAIVDAVAAGINFAGALFEKVRGFFEAFFTALKNFFINIPSIGRAIVDGIVNGILSAPSIFGRVVGFFQDFLDSVKRFFLIGSPSKVFEGFGGFLVDGIVAGINGSKDIFSQVKGVFQSLIDSISKMFKSASGLGSDLLDSIKDGIEGAGDAGKSASDWIGDKTGLWKTGGYTGDGDPNDVAGLVHKGEYVLNADETASLGLNKAGASIQSILNGITGGGIAVSVPAAAGVNVNITLNNVMNAVMQADGREIARLVFRNIDSVGGQYFGSQS